VAKPRLMLALMSVLMLSAYAAVAARTDAPAKPSIELEELIVIEAQNCIYCAIFRRDVMPNYRRSKRGADLPIRFVDLNDAEADHLKLAAAITTVPTIVLMRGGTEAGRLVGYTGPEGFFHSLARLLGLPE
jgi:hypothetical protein